MKIIKTKHEILIYPFLDEDDIEQENDYCIAMDKSDFIIVDGRILDEAEIRQLVDGLETTLDLAIHNVLE